MLHSLAAPLALALCAAMPARAQEGPEDTGATTAPPPQKEQLPLWELGAVGVAGYQPAYPGSDQNFARFRLLPYGIYRGSLLRVDGTGIGLRSLSTPRFEWDISGSASFGASANRVKVREGMPAIATLVEIGPAIRINLGDLAGSRHDLRPTRLEIPIRAVFDVDGGISHRGWTFEPRLSHTAWADRSLALVVSASTLFANRSLSHLFYGVDPAYATPARPAYQASAGLVATRLNASLRHRVDSTLRLQYFAQVESVRGGANETSPLVRSQLDAGLGVSLIWGPWHSAESGTE